jgi:hypothetical protein
MLKHPWRIFTKICQTYSQHRLGKPRSPELATSNLATAIYCSRMMRKFVDSMAYGWFALWAQCNPQVCHHFDIDSTSDPQLFTIPVTFSGPKPGTSELRCIRRFWLGLSCFQWSPLSSSCVAQSLFNWWSWFAYLTGCLRYLRWRIEIQII